LQVKVEPVSVDAKTMLALVLDVNAAGPDEIVVSGGVVSAGLIVQVYEAGVASVLPAPSVARTWNVWLPAASVE
jgi:methylmalonyl-CoA mutase cobalamin-binding subunit